MAELLFQHSRALVFCGSWQEVLPLIPSVDVTITDPPYTDHVQSNIRSCTTHAGPVKVREWAPEFEPLRGYEHVPAFLSHTNRWVLCFCALEQYGEYLEAAPNGQRSSKNAKGTYVRSWVWRKKQAAPQLSGDRPANSCEGIAVMHRPGKMHWRGRGSHAWTDLERSEFGDDESVDNCCIFGRDRSQKRHPTQKPAALCEHLVEKFSDPGELVADWYCGSGAIPAAALKLGRSVIACDIDSEWAQFTADRLRDLLT